MKRSEYLREKLIKQGIAPERLTVRHLTYQEVTRQMSSEEMQWHQTENRVNFDKALVQPRAQVEAQASKDRNDFERFSNGRGWSENDHRELVANMRRIKAEFPAVVTNPRNSDAIAGWLLGNRRYPSYLNVRLAVTTLAVEGKLTLNPSAVGIPEDLYGDFIEGPYQINRVSANDLRLMTEPFRPQSERDESMLSADEYWEAHPELAAERFKHQRAAAFSESVRKADNAVEQFLNSKVGLQYEPTDENKAVLIGYLTNNKLDLTAENLVAAFNACRPKLQQSDKIKTYGGTTVVVFDAQ